MGQNYNNESMLKNSVEGLLTHVDLNLHQNLIKRLSTELGVSILECAAAISLLNQPDFYSKKNNGSRDVDKVKTNLSLPVLPKQRVVRYRLDIGLINKVQVDEIKTILVEVSGVDKKKISKVDIRNHYTIVDLPEGMAPDIFQLISETEIQNKKLNIKRVKFHRRFHRRNKRNSG
jgi:ATP-dependent RNA helicase DeaD